MFKKKEPSPVKISQTKVNELTSLIARMQKNADQVEKNILKAEELLSEDSTKKKKDRPLLHQTESAKNLSEAEGLLKDLFIDVDKAKKLQHPQSNEIEMDVSNLHDRWSKDCTTYRDLYGQLLEVELRPRLEWAQLLRDKQAQVNDEEYGPKLADVEKQIAAHNILHREIEAYGSQLQPSSFTSKDEYSAIQKQYSKLLESSQLRSKSLSSLYDLMQGCSKELAYLKEQQNKILSRDWSDRMVDPPGVRMEYERFKNNGLLQHEGEVNKLQDDAERLLEKNHPATAVIQAHQDALQNEWQCFLNLLICQDTHLDNVEDYKKYLLDAETFSESVKRINSTMDPTVLQRMSSPEILLQLESEERAIERNQQRLADLRELCSTFAPLPLRRTRPSKSTSVIALCDWKTDKHSVTRGEKYTLVSNSGEDWEVKSSTGETKLIPGVCFLIPPPDSDAISRVDGLARDLDELKKRRAALQASVKTPSVEVVKVVKSATVASAPEDPKAATLVTRLDQINAGLLDLEKNMLRRMRTPLDRSNPSNDLSNRLRDHEKSVLTLRDLEAEKATVQREMGPLLSQKPLGPRIYSLSQKLNTATNKIDDISTLAELYKKKATASMYLEKQIKEVDKILRGFESRLAQDTVIPNAPNAIQTHNQELQVMQRDLLSNKSDIQKLNHELETTEQLCRSLQKNFQEYCPDIRQQETEVKHLRNRYTNISNQLQFRSALMQEAASKNQSFQSTVQSLNAFLINMPNNKIKPGDSMTQINSKNNSQKRVVEDIKRKSDDVDLAVSLSRDLQTILNEYEANSEKYRTTLDIVETDAKRPHTSNLCDGVQKRERDIVNLYTEVSAENNQLLNQMGLAKNIVNKNEEIVSQVAVKQQMQMQSQQRDLEEMENLKRELEEEITRRTHAENDLETYSKRMVSLKSRRGVERLEEKEIVQYYRDPKLEADLEVLKKKIQEETQNRTGTRSEIDIINQKIIRLETELTRIEPKLVTKVITEFERDPQLDKEAARIREEMQRLKDEVRVRETETVHMQSEITLLEQKRPTVKQKVMKKEVLKLEKDPEMLKAVMAFKSEISDEGIRIKNLNDDIFYIRSQINTLERIIPTIQPKIVLKEVKKVEQDPQLINESKILRTGLDEEMHANTEILKEVTHLQRRYGEVAKLKPKIEVKEIINEKFRVDPETEAALRRMKKEIQDTTRHYTALENQINTVTVELQSLRSQEPKVELKEVTQEVIKEEKSPEIIREMKRLNEQASTLRVTYDSTLDQLNLLRKKRDELKAEKSKVEMQLVTKEVIKYENDPLLEKEADRLRRDVRQEIQNRRNVEEVVFDLQNQYILLERKKPEEKVVVQEVLRLEKDPKQIVEHERLSKRLDEEINSRRQLDLEVQQLRALVLEKKKNLEQMNDHQKKILVETELRKIKIRIHELESIPPPIEEKIVIEEVLKVERDPKLEKLTEGLRTDLETESTSTSRLEKDIQNLKTRIDILQKEKSLEKTVYKEVIRVEKDQAVEAERARLRDDVTHERNARRDQEDEIQRLNSKLTRLLALKTTITEEEASLILNRDALKKEKDSLLGELETLEGDRHSITIKFQQQSKLMSERNQMNRQRNIKLESEIQRLENNILDEKDKIHQREITIMELQSSVKKEDHSETHTRETNLSTKITILDPETGKDMSPYDAYLEGLIDRNQYIHLQELECNWEEITTTGPDGETSVLQDCKSGKQYSIVNALKEGRLTEYDLKRYKEGKLPISEFALLVAGEKKPKPFIGSLNSTVSVSGDEHFPISGILDTTTDSRMSVRSAMTRKLIDKEMALYLLEAQAATGGIVDIGQKDRFSVHKAADRGLIDSSQLHKLLNAQKAFTGVQDPVSNERFSIGEAAQKGYIPKENAMRYMEAQMLTGGLVDPNRAGRIRITEALECKMIDDAMAADLRENFKYAKYLTDPVTKKKISYKEAMDQSKRDHHTGLLLFPVASTDSTDAPSYSSYKFRSSHTQI
ncbi:envoplakin [Chanos chanos]|uniref:Envoplakin n=1 Tax=Chanos chanos TaxID=29144 RepID=A0A6J2WRM2_CHACN|nr:envoplakin-like [Chanos chanos]